MVTEVLLDIRTRVLRWGGGIHAFYRARGKGLDAGRRSGRESCVGVVFHSGHAGHASPRSVGV